MSIAAARPMATPVAPDPDMLGGIMDTLGPLGFAWLEHGVPPDSSTAASDLDAIFAVSRFAIPPGADAADAHAILDRAGAAALATGGAVVVMAATEEPVLLALQLWSGAGDAALAPLSAVVRRQNGGDVMPEEPGTADGGNAEQSAATPETAETAETGEPAN